MPEPVLRLNRLSKRFSSLVVTDDVSLDVAPGEIHALIGPNGAGKTTSINQISGLISPDEGRIVFAGDDITTLPPEARALRGLSRSFRITSILPGFSVLENVALAVQARDGSSMRFIGAPPRKARSMSLPWTPWSKPASRLERTSAPEVAARRETRAGACNRPRQ